MSLDFFLETPLFALICLFSTLSLTALSASTLRLGRFKSKELLRHSFFFFLPLLKSLFHRKEFPVLHVALGLTKTIYQFLYALCGFLFLSTTSSYLQLCSESGMIQPSILALLISFGMLLSVLLLCDFTIQLVATAWPRKVLKISAPFASSFLSLLFPLVGLLLLLTRGLSRSFYPEVENIGTTPSRAQIKELFYESELQHHLDPFGQKLVTSFINFKGRVAKEIMVPRVNLFSLPAETLIREAAPLFTREGYSRIPIYRDSLDQIVGVVLYKDLLQCYVNASSGENGLNAPLETISKPVLYSPENKKIAQLLQEFRTKQIHMAIIVDEYGGTEGIVTIEDILEELVGEIEDEYDTARDQPFWALPNGGWVVDAKMSILDIEEQLGIRIPPDPEYETIGGYVFHCAGMIPAKGWRLMHDDFDLEVLNSNERSLKKIKLVPHHKPDNAHS